MFFTFGKQVLIYILIVPLKKFCHTSNMTFIIFS